MSRKRIEGHNTAEIDTQSYMHCKHKIDSHKHLDSAFNVPLIAAIGDGSCMTIA